MDVKERPQLRLINAGFGRTGTTSLQAALGQLGIEPSYKMSDIVTHAEHPALWQAAARGELRNWDHILGGYGAILEPSAHFYRQLIIAYPNAKVLLTRRDPSRWYDSMRGTMYRRQRFLQSPLGSALLQFAPRWRIVRDLSEVTLWQGVFQGRFDNRAWAISRYNQHNEDVRAVVPPGRLLEYDVRDGWAPLCAFLDVPVPNGIPFPNVNSTAQVSQRVRRRAIGAVLALGVVVGIVGLFARR